MVVTLEYTYVDTTTNEDITEIATVTIPKDSSSVEFDIQTIADTLFEGNEVFKVSILSISNTDDYEQFDINNTPVTTEIIDDETLSMNIDRALVDEDALVNTSDNDGYNTVKTFTGSYSFNTNLDVDVTFKAGQTTSLTSKGEAITLELSADKNTLVGKSGTREIFEITLDEANNEYTVTLKDVIDHGDITSEDLETLSVLLEGTTVVGNVEATLNIDIADDIVTVDNTNAETVSIDNSQFTNMIINGSFENVTGFKTSGSDAFVENKDLSSGSWIGLQAMEGWELLSKSSMWMEPHEQAHASIGADDGENYMDLGETNSNDSDVENTHIGQIISGVQDGVTYDLSFAFRDKAFTQANEADSGKMQVIWNGEVIATIDGDNSSWETMNLQVVGGSGDNSNRLEFKEIGEGNDNWGMALDDIQMSATSIHYTGSLSDNSGLDVNFGADGKGSYELASKTGWTLSSDKSTLTKDDGSLKVWMNSSNGEYFVQQLKPTTLGDISVPVKITDGDGDSVTTNINISVENKTPELPDSITVKLLDSDSVLEGETLAHRVKLYDANGNEVAVPEGEYVEVTLTYTASGSNGAVEDVDYTSQNTVRIYGGTSGTYVFNDTLTDNSYEGSESYTVSVSNVTSSSSEIESKLNVSNQTVTGTIVDGNTPPEADDRHIEIECNNKTYSSGLESEYYGVNVQISNLEQFKSIVSSNNPDATFTATTINYGQGSGSVSQGTNLQEFLKSDASSLSNDPGNTSDGGIFMAGKVYLEAGTYNFKVLGDDGYDIIINGQSVATYDVNQPPQERVHGEFTISESGYHDIEMFWWDQGGEYVFKPEISSDGGTTYEILDSSMLFTEQSTTPTAQTVEFTLEDFVSDIEDDANATTVKIKIVSLPEDGVLTVNGNAVEIGDIYDETAQIVYTPNANQEDTLYGTTANSGTLDEWGTISNGVLTTDDGNAVIKAYSDGILSEVGFASQNNNYHHDGLGLGVVGSTDNDQIELNGNEKLVIEFKETVTNAEFGLASLGNNFAPGDSADAKAHWIAYKDGVKVDEGYVKQSTDDSNPTTNSFEVNVEFDSIEFTTIANVNSNFSVQYMNVDYKVDDSFDYIAIDSNGVESNEATVTFDMNTKACTLKNIAPDAVDDTKSLNENSAININVLSNDIDVDGDVLTVTSVTQPAYGTVVINSDGTVKYTPTADYVGNDSFTYTIVDEHGATDTATVTLTVNKVNEAPTITNGYAVVSEEALVDGIKDTQGNPDSTNSKVYTGKLSVNDVNIEDSLSLTLRAPIEVLKATNGQAISWYGEGTNTLIGKVGTQDVLKVTIDDAGNYKVELFDNVKHPVQNVEDVLSLNFKVDVTDGSLTTTGNLRVDIEDDSGVANMSEQTIIVEKDTVFIKNLDAGFVNSQFHNGTSQVSTHNTDSDNYVDSMYWGSPVNGSQKSGYTLVDNSLYTSSTGSQVDTNGIFKLADFSHENWAIYANSSTLDKTTVTMSMDVIINGKSVSVSFDVLLEHTETPNSNDVMASRDIITLPDGDIHVNVDGKDFAFTVEGFRNSNGEYVKEIYTNEAASNNFEIYASIKPATALPEVSGTINYAAGADGLESITWGDLTSQYGTMTVDANGNYKFVVNQNTKDNIAANQNIVEEFTYTITDKDGDTSTSSVKINISGTQSSNTIPDAVDDRLAVWESIATNIDVLANDTDADGDTLRITNVDSNVMLNGKVVGTAEIVTINGVDKVRFTPNQNFDLVKDERETIEINYQITDGNGGYDSATALVDVVGVDDEADSPNLSMQVCYVETIKYGSNSSGYYVMGSYSSDGSWYGDDSYNSGSYSYGDDSYGGGYFSWGGNTGYCYNTYKYKISVQSSLNDTDGSETLSQVTLSNIPNGMNLYINNVQIHPNADGTYTVPNNVDVYGLINRVPSTYEFNSIRASVTAHETNDGIYRGSIDGEDMTITVDRFANKTAQLIDGVVEGVEYETSSGVKGITDKDGNFSYKEGDSITFKIGGVILGVATAEDVASGKTFLQDIADVERTDLNDEYLENLATFLQSLDVNADAYDGIVITEEIRTALENVSIDLRTASEEEVKALVESVGKEYVSEKDAMQHVKDMLVEYTDLTEEEFEEHISDDLTLAVLGNKPLSNIEYVTTSGIKGMTNDKGEFVFNEEDDITFIKDGEVLATVETSVIGEDSLITVEELNEFNIASNTELLGQDIDLEVLVLVGDNSDNEISSNINDVDIDIDEVIESASEELKIFKEGDNSISLENSDELWSNEGTKEIDGEKYSVYKGTSTSTSNIKVLIDEDVSIEPDL